MAETYLRIVLAHTGKTEELRWQSQGTGQSVANANYEQVQLVLGSLNTHTQPSNVILAKAGVHFSPHIPESVEKGLHPPLFTLSVIPAKEGIDREMDPRAGGGRKRP